MILPPIGLLHYLILSLCLFCLGLLAVITRRHAIGILLGIELMLNSASVNLVAFSHFLSPVDAQGNLLLTTVLDGQVFVLMIIALAACEAAVGLAIILRFYRQSAVTDVADAKLLKW